MVIEAQGPPDSTAFALGFKSAHPHEYVFYLCVHVSTCLYMHCVHADACGGQGTDPMELGLCCKPPVVGAGN